ncbi:transcriptional regulator [Actinobacillus equuli subsp. haemolyticus]|uniref:DNA-binding protein n=1 Tax=Actinobacillus equuli TaxID=718 RepID=UPI0024187DAC|nr:DNA-binding protein [Actinobacillus equuli]MDG4949174.1 transcriptional regulator [Actinobacillus equuli subsp. haemolyticus]
MKNSKEWFSVSELLSEKLEDLPKTDKGISKKADREQWEKRQRAGVKGKTFEYHYSSLPESVQLALGFGNKVREAEATNSYKISQVDTSNDYITVSRQRFITAISTLEEILEITHKQMKPEAKAQMVLMIYELLSEESANEKIIEMVKLVA